MTDVFRLWAETYDGSPNPLLALGDRTLGDALGDLGGLRVLDAGCGTGRWMRTARGACVVGFDGEAAMLRRAPAGRTALARLGAAPFLAGSFDLVVSSFSLSYARDPAAAVAELLRLVKVGGRFAAVDLHGEAVRAGWRRTFPHGGETVEIPSKVELLEAPLGQLPAGWDVACAESAKFGEPERGFFDPERWAKVSTVRAVSVTVWRKK